MNNANNGGRNEITISLENCPVPVDLNNAKRIKIDTKLTLIYKDFTTEAGEKIDWRLEFIRGPSNRVGNNGPEENGHRDNENAHGSNDNGDRPNDGGPGLDDKHFINLKLMSILMHPVTGYIKYYYHPANSTNKIKRYLHKSSLVEFNNLMQTNYEIELNIDLIRDNDFNEVDEVTIICKLALFPNVSIYDNDNCSLNKDMQKLLNDPSCCDIIFYEGSYRAKAHKCILKARAPSLFNKFNNNNNSVPMRSRRQEQDDTDTFYMKNIKVFKIFLEYLYTDKISNLSDSEVKILWEFSSEYDVKSLKKYCESFMIKNLTVNNAIYCLIFASKNRLKDVSEKTMKFIVQNFNSIRNNTIIMNQLQHGHPKLLIKIYAEVTNQLIPNV